jgi:hypothetical protein
VLMTELSAPLFAKAILRVAPLFLMIKVPADVNFPFAFRLLPSIALATILAMRFQAEGELQSTGYFFDFGVGLSMAIIISLFFAAAMHATKFFRDEHTDEEESTPWKQVLDAFCFIVITLLLLSLRLERTILELLGSIKSSDSISANLQNIDTWTKLLKEVTILGLKVSSFSFILVFTKAMFSEIYRRLGGEGLKLVFSFSFWIIFLAMSPLLIPAFGGFLSEQLSGFWKAWIGS